MRGSDQKLRDTSDEDFISRTAHEFKAFDPAIDEEALEVTFAVYASSMAILNATGSLTRSLGLGRATRRYGVLRALYASPERELSHTEIAKRLFLHASPITEVVDGLEEEGLVKRHDSPLDRRLSLVKLTPKGEETCARLVPAMAEISERFCAGLSEAEKETLAKLLMRCSRNLREENAPVAKASAAR
jgi:DNA-binding MarR family transcriptional regulator